MHSQYTAQLFYNNEHLDTHNGNDLNKLMATLLNQIEMSSTSTQGHIINNVSGKIIHRCRKTCVE